MKNLADNQSPETGYYQYSQEVSIKYLQSATKNPEMAITYINLLMDGIRKVTPDGYEFAKDTIEINLIAELRRSK